MTKETAQPASSSSQQPVGNDNATSSGASYQWTPNELSFLCVQEGYKDFLYILLGGQHVVQAQTLETFQAKIHSLNQMKKFHSFKEELLNQLKAEIVSSNLQHSDLKPHVANLVQQKLSIFKADKDMQTFHEKVDTFVGDLQKDIFATNESDFATIATMQIDRKLSQAKDKRKSFENNKKQLTENHANFNQNIQSSVQALIDDICVHKKSCLPKHMQGTDELELKRQLQSYVGTVKPSVMQHGNNLFHEACKFHQWEIAGLLKNTFGFNENLKTEKGEDIGQLAKLRTSVVLQLVENSVRLQASKFRRKLEKEIQEKYTKKLFIERAKVLDVLGPRIYYFFVNKNREEQRKKIVHDLNERLEENKLNKYDDELMQHIHWIFQATSKDEREGLLFKLLTPIFDDANKEPGFSNTKMTVTISAQQAHYDRTITEMGQNAENINKRHDDLKTKYEAAKQETEAAKKETEAAKKETEVARKETEKEVAEKNKIEEEKSAAEKNVEYYKKISDDYAQKLESVKESVKESVLKQVQEQMEKSIKEQVEQRLKELKDSKPKDENQFSSVIQEAKLNKCLERFEKANVATRLNVWQDIKKLGLATHPKIVEALYGKLPANDPDIVLQVAGFLIEIKEFKDLKDFLNLYASPDEDEHVQKQAKELLEQLVKVESEANKVPSNSNDGAEGQSDKKDSDKGPIPDFTP